jgi:hypothetical protein
MYITLLTRPGETLTRPGDTLTRPGDTLTWPGHTYQAGMRCHKPPRPPKQGCVGMRCHIIGLGVDRILAWGGRGGCQGVARVARVANSINIDNASSKLTPRSEKWSGRVY